MQDVDRNSQGHQHKAVEELQVALVTTHAPALQKVQWNLLQMGPGKTKEVDVQVLASCKQVPFPFVPLFGCLAHGSSILKDGLHLLLKLLSFLPNLMSKLMSRGSTLITCTKKPHKVLVMLWENPKNNRFTDVASEKSKP